MATDEDVNEVLDDLNILLDLEKRDIQLDRARFKQIIQSAISLIEALHNVREVAQPIEQPFLLQPLAIGSIRDIAVQVEPNFGSASSGQFFGRSMTETRRQIFDGRDFQDWDSPEATAVLNIMFLRIRQLEQDVKEITGESR